MHRNPLPFAFINCTISSVVRLSGPLQTGCCETGRACALSPHDWGRPRGRGAESPRVGLFGMSSIGRYCCLFQRCWVMHRVQLSLDRSWPGLGNYVRHSSESVSVWNEQVWNHGRCIFLPCLGHFNKPPPPLVAPSQSPLHCLGCDVTGPRGCLVSGLQLGKEVAADE